MTTRYQHPNVADAALNYVKANGTQLVLVAGLAASDTYTQAMAKKVASVSLATTDYTIAADGTARKLTTASKTGTATATTTAGTDLGFMITDGSATILLVFEESSDMAVTSGNPVTFPAQNYSIPQPVAA